MLVVELVLEPALLELEALCPNANEAIANTAVVTIAAQFLFMPSSLRWVMICQGNGLRVCNISLSDANSLTQSALGTHALTVLL
jgi:hypothetical protein